MDFALTDEQQELAATVRSLLDKRGDLRVERYDEALWSTLCEQIGVAALNVPEEHDGVGASLFESLVVLEEVGRALVPSPLFSTLVVPTSTGCPAACRSAMSLTTASNFATSFL